LRTLEPVILDRRGLLFSLLAAAPALVASDSQAAETTSSNEEWLNAFGLRLKVEVTTSSTGGSMSCTRVIAPPGGGPPAHIHTREDEVFIILRGHYRFWQKDMPTIEASPGSLVRLHKEMIHQYRNVSEREGEHLFFCLPGGLEKLFVDISGEGLQLPKDLRRVEELSTSYGITYKPPLDTWLL
jgi:quercetin dioxygenase-like cupin family protein